MERETSVRGRGRIKCMAEKGADSAEECGIGLIWR